MEVQQVSIFIENKSGRLSAVTKTLGENDINILAMSASDTIDFGILRLVVDQPQLALKKLKEAGFTATITKTIAIGIDNSAGALSHAMELFRDNNLSVEYIYAFTNQHKKAYVILRLNDNQKAIEVLKQNGVEIISEEKMYAL